MEWPEFCQGGSYLLETVNAGSARSLNVFPETIQRGIRAGKQRQRGIPGLSLFKTVASAPLRCLWSNATSCFAIAGGKLWQIFDDATPNLLIGSLDNGTNPAIIDSNGFQLAIASAGVAYIAPGGLPPGAGVIPILDTSGAPVNAATLAFMDQYFIAGIRDSKLVQISNLAPAGGVWDPGDVAIKEAYSDQIQRVWVDQPGGELLWIFGTDTTEVWTDTGGLFPFQRIQSMVFPIGCDSAWSVAGVVGNRFWLWRGVIYWASGYQPQRVSDYGVEEAIKTYSLYDQQNAEAFSWVDGGHIFYAISFPQASKTWVFDLAEKSWHERLYFTNGVWSRYRPRVYTKAFGMHLVGDYETGNIYSMDPTVYTDAGGVALRRQRVAPYLTDSMRNDRYNQLTLDMDTGVGITGAPGSLGQNPQVMMRYSLNRGKNWSSELTQSAGPIGDNFRRVIWSQLGSSYIGPTVEITFTDPCPLSINTAYIDISPSTAARQ